jgi:hypothetical protein
VSGNVLVMSMLARKMIEGMTMVHLGYMLETRPALAERFKAWAEKYATVPNEKITKAVTDALQKPISPNDELKKLVDDWKDSGED